MASPGRPHHIILPALSGKETILLLLLLYKYKFIQYAVFKIISDRPLVRTIVNALNGRLENLCSN